MTVVLLLDSVILNFLLLDLVCLLFAFEDKGSSFGLLLHLLGLGLF